VSEGTVTYNYFSSQTANCTGRKMRPAKLKHRQRGINSRETSILCIIYQQKIEMMIDMQIRKKPACPVFFQKII
jgi:hypothetical protein